MKNRLAFPVSAVDSITGNSYLEQGMTLREYIAIEAMKSCISNVSSITVKANRISICDYSIKMADEMLKEFEK